MIEKIRAIEKHQETLHQLIKYGVVGVSANLMGYFLFLAITHFGMPHKLAMTALYCVGVAISYLGNKSWTFEHKNNYRSTPLKFMLAHSIGYCINLSMLFVGVDYMEYPYQLVQFVAIFVVAAYLFVMFKLFVFDQG